jgi:arylsulfatase A-like enzyme
VSRRVALVLAVSAVLPACRRGEPAPASGTRLFRSGGLETARVPIGAETREALAAPATPFVSRFTVPPAATLQLAIGLKCPGRKRCAGAFHFIVEDRVSGSRLFERTLDAASAEGWADVRIPLGALAGRRAEAAFTATQVEPGAARGFWGEARLLYPGPQHPKSVLLISVDTLRADRLGCYGYGRPTSPRLDGLAREGVRFQQAISQAPWTTPSHMSMLTSRYPSSHGVTQSWSMFDKFLSEGRGYRLLAEEATTLAEVLQGQGYRTLALTGGATLGGEVGFAQGFDAYRDDSHGLHKRVRPMLRRWLEDSRDVPFFIFFHTFEVHAPYLHTDLAEGVLTDAQRDVIREGARQPGHEDVDGFASLLKDLGLFRREVTSALYDGGIRFTDAFLGALFEDLDHLGLAESTLVVVTSDHGEEFGEHHPARFYDAHCATVFEEAIRVPLILRLPGSLPAGRVVEAPVELVDVAPTILEALQIGVPAAMEGQSFWGLATGRRRESKEWTLSEATCADPETKALRGRGVKYVVSYEARSGEHAGVPGPLVTEQLFDLLRDPGEQQALTAPGRLPELRSVLEARATALERNAPRGTEAAVGQDTLDRLRGLGYLK